MDVGLLEIQIRMMRYMKRYPCSVVMLESLLQLDLRWKVAHYLGKLEEYELIEELSQPEVDAFMRGDDYKELETGDAGCGRYALTDSGEIVLDEWDDRQRKSIKEVLVPALTTVLGAVLGYLLSGR